MYRTEERKISRTFSVSQQCFSLTINQPTVISALTFQTSEQSITALRQPLSLM